MSASTDTIAALATGWGGGSPAALVRLSGPGVDEVLTTLLESNGLSGAGVPPAMMNAKGQPVSGRDFCARPTQAKNPVVQRVSFLLRPVNAPEGVASLPVPCVVAYYAAGRSYTGEASAELILPGNAALVERVVAQLAAMPGVREAGPGEFSARAYLGGRLSLDQAEGVAAMIAAGSDEQLAAAARLLSGEAGRAYRDWADRVAGLLALVEAGIDFTDQEDVVPIAPKELAARLDTLVTELRGTLGAATGREHRAHEPSAVLYGEPNAGKSTLFNALLGRRRAVVSDVAGTTRDALRETLDLSADCPGAEPVTLVDLAGVGETVFNALDAEAQRRAREEIEDADVVLWCDPSGRFMREPKTQGTVVRVRTKADLLSPAQSEEGVSVCALDGFNLGTLRRAIADAVWNGSTKGSSGGASLIPRHRRALAAALDAIASAREKIAEPFGHALTNVELVAGDLRSGLDALEELAGRISPDDVIGRVFATFCVGK